MIWTVFILAEVYRNWHIIEVKKSRPDYRMSFIIRGMAAILHGRLADIISSDIELLEFGDYLPILIFQVTSFWIVFDLVLNVVRGKSIFHKGKNSGWLDKLPSSIYWTFKAIALIALIYVLI